MVVVMVGVGVIGFNAKADPGPNAEPVFKDAETPFHREKRFNVDFDDQVPTTENPIWWWNHGTVYGAANLDDGDSDGTTLDFALKHNSEYWVPKQYVNDPEHLKFYLFSGGDSYADIGDLPDVWSAQLTYNNYNETLYVSKPENGAADVEHVATYCTPAEAGSNLLEVYYNARVGFHSWPDGWGYEVRVYWQPLSGGDWTLMGSKVMGPREVLQDVFAKRIDWLIDEVAIKIQLYDRGYSNEPPTGYTYELLDSILISPIECPVPPSPLPTPDPSATPTPTPTPDPTPSTHPTPTPSEEPTPTPSEEPTPTPTPEE